MAMLNTFLAIFVLLGGLLCGRAFLPHVNVMGGRPADNLARGLMVCAFGAFPRIAYWDVFWGAMGVSLPGGIVTNLLFNTALLIGIYYILKARWLTIPEDERGRSNLVTAVFYPSNIFPRLRRED